MDRTIVKVPVKTGGEHHQKYSGVDPCRRKRIPMFTKNLSRQVTRMLALPGRNFLPEALPTQTIPGKPGGERGVDGHATERRTCSVSFRSRERQAADINLCRSPKSFGSLRAEEMPPGSRRVTGASRCWPGPWDKSERSVRFVQRAYGPARNLNDGKGER